MKLLRLLLVASFAGSALAMQEEAVVSFLVSFFGFGFDVAEMIIVYLGGGDLSNEVAEKHMLCQLRQGLMRVMDGDPSNGHFTGWQSPNSTHQTLGGWLSSSPGPADDEFWVFEDDADKADKENAPFDEISFGGGDYELDSSTIYVDYSMSPQDFAAFLRPLVEQCEETDLQPDSFFDFKVAYNICQVLSFLLGFAGFIIGWMLAKDGKGFVGFISQFVEFVLSIISIIGANNNMKRSALFGMAVTGVIIQYIASVAHAAGVA